MNFEVIKHKQFSFVYITTKDCNVCKVLQPQLSKLINSFPEAELKLIELDEHPKAAGEFMAFTVPTFIGFSQGKELLRASRNLNLYDIKDKLRKYYKLIFEQ